MRVGIIVLLTQTTTDTKGTIAHEEGRIFAWYGERSGRLYVYVSSLVKEHSPDYEPVRSEVERTGARLVERTTVSDPDMRFGQAVLLEYHAGGTEGVLEAA